MTRDDIKKEIINLQGSNFLLELPTGTGKSKLAIDKLKSLSKNTKETLLIVVPRNVLKETWQYELNKWWPLNNLNVKYTTYISFPKYKGTWDFCIFDEVHHLTERCREVMNDFSIRNSILLSATVSKGLKDSLKDLFKDITIFKKTLRSIIDENILPDPKVYLLPLTLDNNTPSEIIFKNKKAKGNIVECTWANRWKWITQKSFPVKIKCTEQQYHINLCNQIEYWKRRSNNVIGKNKWLKLCSDRLKYLSDKKLQYIFPILETFKRKRTLTFCNSIEQTELLGKYCINSKNDKSLKHLLDFNEGKINHITACNMLNEGCNLVNCQIGIYANLNSSETIVKQRTGRLLRHPNPIIIIPYFKNTREEELVQKMLENYNPSLIKTISNVKEIHL